MKEKKLANMIRIGVLGAAAVGLLGLQITQASADGWGDWAPAGQTATCSQSFSQSIGTQWEALSGYAAANGNQVSAITPCNQGTLNPASLAWGETRAWGYPYYNNTTYVVTPAETETQTTTAPGSLSHSICQVVGYNLL